MDRKEKTQAVQDLADKLTRSKAALVANYQGLNVANVMEIRRAFRAAGVEYKVVKNTLMKIALKGTKREKIGGSFTGTTCVLFKYDEEIAKLGKAAKEIATKFDKFQVKAGFVEDDIIDGIRAMEVMAALPTLDEARAQLLGVVNAPAAKLLAQVNAPAQNLIGVVLAKKEKDEKAGTPA